MKLPLCGLCLHLLAEALPHVREAAATVVGTRHAATLASHLAVGVLGGDRRGRDKRPRSGYTADAADTGEGRVAGLTDWGRTAGRRLSAP